MSETQGPGRRRVLQVLAGGAGAGLVASGGAAAPRHDHPVAEAAPAAPSEDAAAERLLDPHQMETLSSLAEAVIPGSAAAGVPAFVDRLLAADTREHQASFLAALAAIQAEAIARFSKPWLGLGAAQRVELLAAVSSSPRSREPRYWTPGEPVLVPEPPPTPPTIRDRFERLKETIATAYWSSEAGMRDLGWTGEMIHAAFPICPDPGARP